MTAWEYEMLLPRESLFIGFRNGVVVHGTPASGQRTANDGRWRGGQGTGGQSDGMKPWPGHRDRGESVGKGEQRLAFQMDSRAIEIQVRENRMRGKKISQVQSTGVTG